MLNSGGGVARNIIRALDHPNLEKIANSACDLVKNEYTYEAAVKGMSSILTSLK